MPEPVSLSFYDDVLCPWSYVAEARLESIRLEFRERIRWSVRPFPLLPREGRVTARVRSRLLADVARANREPEGARLSGALWSAPMPPGSSVPAHVALEGARLQGEDAHAALARAMRVAALEHGLDVARRDIVYELADRVGLHLNRFAAAFDSPHAERLVREEQRFAYARGVRGVPTLVIADRWMVTGLCEVAEYREHLMRCLKRLETEGSGAQETQLH